MRPFAARTFLGLALSGLMIAPAPAETLREAWQLAAQQDDLLASAGLDAEAARAELRAARAGRWPTLSATAGYTRFGEAPQLSLATPSMSLVAPVFAGDDYRTHDLRLALPLFTSGAVSARIDAARRVAAGADAGERATAATLRLDVAESYVAVLRCQRLLAAQRSTVDSLRAHVSDVNHLVERELVARSDLLAAQVALANASQTLVRLENAQAVAYAVYNRRLGQPLDRIPELEQGLPLEAGLADEPLATLIQRALDARPDLQALAAQAEALDGQARAARAAQWPQLTLAADRLYLENQVLDRQDFDTVSVQLTWNLFDGSARAHAAALRSQGRAAARRADDHRSRIELAVRQAWLDIREARARVAASAQAVAQAEENLRLSREMYGAGLVNNTQVLDAAALQVAAAHNLDNATLDEALARLRLQYATGSL